MKISKHIGWLCLLLLASHSGCTIAPKIAKAKQASFSSTPDPTGNYQTSGVWGWRLNHDLIVDHVGRDTYNTLIERGWGANLTPPITNVDAGLAPFTNVVVEPLRGLNGKLTLPAMNPGDLFEMNPLAQQAWPAMTALSRAPVPKPP